MPAPATEFNAFSKLFTQIDGILQRFVNEASANAITTITPIIGVALIIVLVAYGIQVLLGLKQSPTGEVIWKVFLWSAVISIALTAGAYQSGIGDIVRTLPNDVAASMVAGSDTSNSGLGSLLDDTAKVGIDKAKEAFNHPTGFDVGKSVFLTVIGAGILLATLILTVAGGVMLMLATVAVSFLAALGPFFIAALLFDSTRQLFFAWVGHVLYWVAFMVLFALIVTFTMNLYGQYMSQVVISGDAADWIGTIFAANIAAVFGVIFFFKIPSIAAGLTQGGGGSVAGAVGGAVRTAMTTVAIVKTAGIAGAASAGARGAGAAGGAGAGAGGRAAGSGNQPPRNYNRGSGRAS